jgi:hypothetical protein
MLRRLRNVSSGLCISAGIAVVALWVRSYSSWDQVVGPVTDNRWLAIRSLRGTVMLGGGAGHLARWDRRNFGRPQHEEFGFVGSGISLELTKKRQLLGFGVAEIAGGWHLYVPHWFVALSLAVVAAFPWVNWGKRFSLRTLLIVTMLAAVGLVVLMRLG